MGAGAKGQAGLQVEHRAALGVVVVLPQGADEELLPHRDGVEVLFPVVDPVLLHAGVPVDFIGDIFRLEALLQEGDSLGGVGLWADVDVDDGVLPVLLEELLVDEVDVGDLQSLLF